MSGPRVYAQRGFTLLELLVAIIVGGVLLAVAVPMYNSTTLSAQLRSATNDLVSSVNFARSEALKRNAVVTLCVSASGSSCDTGNWQQGWIVGCPTSDNVVCNSAGSQWLVFYREKALASALKVTDANGLVALTFQPTGLGVTAASFTVCRTTAGGQERVVTINTVGRASVKKTTTGVCS